MNEQIARWKTLIAGQRPAAPLHKAVWYIAYNLSTLTGQTISVSSNRISNLPTSALAAHAGAPESELIGVYLLLNDALPGQAILMLTPPSALRVVDWMQGMPPGTAKELHEFERSALGELGNIIVSSFLNVVAQPAWGSLHPSPPAIMVDQLETILDAVATSIATRHETLPVIDVSFQDTAQCCQIRLWIIPNHDEGE